MQSYTISRKERTKNFKNAFHSLVLNLNGGGLLQHKVTLQTVLAMSKHKDKKSRTSAWVVVGTIVLIVLLLIWLTYADLLGDTDVAAFAPSSPEPLA